MTRLLGKKFERWADRRRKEMPTSTRGTMSLKPHRQIEGTRILCFSHQTLSHATTQEVCVCLQPKSAEYIASTEDLFLGLGG